MCLFYIIAWMSPCFFAWLSATTPRETKWSDDRTIKGTLAERLEAVTAFQLPNLSSHYLVCQSPTPSATVIQDNTSLHLVQFTVVHNSLCINKPKLVFKLPNVSWSLLQQTNMATSL